jgi:hypothetical protein
VPTASDKKVEGRGPGAVTTRARELAAAQSKTRVCQRMRCRKALRWRRRPARAKLAGPLHAGLDQQRLEPPLDRCPIRKGPWELGKQLRSDAIGRHICDNAWM